MNYCRQKGSKKKFILLLIIIFSHIFPVLLSAFYDQATHARHQIKLTEVRYGLGFFTGWSAWASLLTVPGAIYKLCTLKRRKSSFSEQIWDMMVMQTNFLSGFIFCCGGFYLTLHTTSKTSRIVFPLVGNVRTIYIGLIYNFFWHVLAPMLVFCCFGKYCSIDKLVKRKWLGLIVNLFNPTIYLLYLILRPQISNFSKSSLLLPHNYPSDYPYPPFFWIMGKFANGTEGRGGRSKFLFLSWKPSPLMGLIGLAITLAFGYLIFSFLFHFFIKIRLRRNNKLVIKC